MGVLGLTYLLKSDERFKDTESLVSLVENHRTSTKTRPLIIIDGRSIYNQIFGKSYPVLFDYAQVHQNLSKLSTLLTSLEVDVEVFFPRGRQDEENILNNAQTQAQRVIYHMRLIHELKPLQFIYKLPGWSYRDVVRFIFGFYFQVVNSMTYCENDLVRYAHSRNCLAIITRELNLVCCDLSIQYWYYESLNYSERTVILFNIRGFADHFNFNVNHMLFVLASFGNRVLTARQMAVTYGNPLEFKIRLDRVTAGLSSRRSLALNELRESPHFEALLDEMFPKAAGTILLYQDFARSLAIYEECYCTNLIEQDNILMYVKALVEQNKIQPSFFYLLKERKFYNVHGFQCLSNRKFQYGRVMEVYADLRKRIYYLLFRDIHCTVQEYWVKDNLENKTTEIETKEINPESAEFEINLSLLELMQNEDDQIRDLKWRILVHSVSSAIDIDQFRHLSPKYYYPVLTLHYLLNLPGERVIEKWEADVFLCHLELENKVPYIVGYNGRALELINIYNSGLTFICYLVAASGFPISIRTLMESNSPEWHFNGEAFYSAYCYLEHRVRDIITDDMSTEPRQLLGLI